MRGEYAHLQPEWPRFRWDERAVADLLGPVRHRQGRLLGRMEGLGFSLQDEAALLHWTDDVLKTSEIEGEHLDRAQVRSSIARHLGLDVGGLVPSERQVDGVVEVVLDATLHHRAPLTVERLWGWHAALFPTGYSGRVPIRVGGWRDDAHGPMQVVSGALGRERVHYEAPAAARLDDEMRAFLAWHEGDDPLDPVVRAAIAHLWFVTVHPFEDGNGRLARAIADLGLARSEGQPRRFYSMSAQIRAERDAYYSILEATQRGDLDVTPWLLWFLGCLDRALVRADAVADEVLRKARFWQAHAAAPLTERQRALVLRLLGGFEGKLTSSKWAKLAKVSQDSAARDLEGLVQLGILRREAGGRSTSYGLVLP